MKPQLETLNKLPEEPKETDINDPNFLAFANDAAKVEPQLQEVPKEKIKITIDLDKDINEAIEKKRKARRTKMSKTQWIIKAILRELGWKDSI